ncbi:Trm112 family protein [Candidatus Nitrosopelagicus sp.]|nr:Trm112 family protein [Candidatus Nitrosopelagicus sp.]
MNKKMLDILACPMCKHHPLESVELDLQNDIIVEGVLFCISCSRFYPIIEEIPIMLPDELRNKEQDIEFLKKNKDTLSDKIILHGKPWHL